jgi:hypothetical protein
LAWNEELVWLLLPVVQVCDEPNAISLASADSEGRPSVRVVLLKGYDSRGFIFYTNYNSRKGQELDSNNSAAFSVYYEKLQQQVSIEKKSLISPSPKYDVAQSTTWPKVQHGPKYDMAQSMTWPKVQHGPKYDMAQSMTWPKV